MEAASARYARDRFGGFDGFAPASTPLQRYIQNSCDPQNFEPNLALNLEIADLINAKKGNAPREAAVAIVQWVNSRNMNVAMLALNLLDICVKNCGYPFHLQISTKEFLNELVRRFPERPPMRSSRAQNKILELIEEWRMTICETSKYKEDLGYIRDMHRLLSYKGYVFPAVKREDAAVLNPSDNLRSAEEMEEEERAAQSAKLQELIRRGGPRDLQEANRLMKVMAGYDTRHKTDYRAKAAEEVGQIQQKARILEEMLQRHRPGDAFQEGDVSEELANALASAHPKIQKMCEEESDDTEAVAKLLEINDSIHRTLERYKLVKNGDLEAAAKIPKGTLGTSGAGVSKGPNDELSLIDLGGPDEPAGFVERAGGSQTSGPAGLTSQSTVEDDLLGLSLEDGGFGQGGGIALALDSNASTAFGSPQHSSASQSVLGQGPNATVSQQASVQAAQQRQPNYDPFASLSSSRPPSKPSTPTPHQQQHSQSTPFRAGVAPTPAASLSAPRQASPFQYHQSTTSGSSLLDMAQASTQPSKTTPLSHRTNGAVADEEWTYASSLPDQNSRVAIHKPDFGITLNLSRQSGPDSVILIKSTISNNLSQLTSNLTFQLAVQKAYQLKLEPQSGRTLSPNQRNGITQTITLYGVEVGKGDSVRLRWRLNYDVGADHREEHGEISHLGIP